MFRSIFAFLGKLVSFLRWYDYCFAYYEVYYFPAASFYPVLLTKIRSEQKKKKNVHILDWCFTNKPKLLLKPVQLPKIGTGDHNALLIKPVNGNQSSNVRAKSKILPDTRVSRLRNFGV